MCERACTYLARRADDYGLKIGRIAVDMERVRERKRSIVENFRGGIENRLEKAHVELIAVKHGLPVLASFEIALLDVECAVLQAARSFSTREHEIWCRGSMASRCPFLGQ